MDAVPSPELRPQSAFFERAHDYAERQLFWDLFKVFSLDDRAAFRKQGAARKAACLQQLQQSGRCEQFNFQSAKGNVFVDVRLDRNCVLIEIKGTSQKKFEVGLPPEIAQLLPKPASEAQPLSCKQAEPTATPDYTGQPAAYGRVTYKFG
jgi:hypothetical protein